ncbi:hypothetical protein XF_0299 [Xylella fastidiosa 9a5c]|uniref:Uncharacterized protein n=1 Tax=Xylella fastidiosa (strain 9a5c) TaxID=160492 RepID=Q9PGK1_XYLFA|nr:hypothetical protein XF_0299 [Xylella fastidiosa 9a5c]
MTTSAADAISLASRFGLVNLQGVAPDIQEQVALGWNPPLAAQPP